MGSCVSSNKGDKKAPEKTTVINLNCSPLANADMQYLDMPEWEGERYKGIGIKRMKGYKCTLPIDELNKLREDYWNCSQRKNYIWRRIRQACIMDDIRSKEIIDSSGLKTVNGCVNHLADGQGKRYYVPNFCINDPYFEKTVEDCQVPMCVNQDGNLVLKSLKLYLNSTYTNRKILLVVDENTTGEEIKKLYLKACQLEEDPNNFRLFFGGSEILDMHKLHQHKLKNDYTIQIFHTNKKTVL